MSEVATVKSVSVKFLCAATTCGEHGDLSINAVRLRLPAIRSCGQPNPTVITRTGHSWCSAPLAKLMDPIQRRTRSTMSHDRFFMLV